VRRAEGRGRDAPAACWRCRGAASRPRLQVFQL
jgi:hypothetical protein